MLVVNEREALGLSGKDTVAEAGAMLAERVETVVVTLAGEGAISVRTARRSPSRRSGSSTRRTRPGPATCSPRPTSGRTLNGAEPEDRLRWAVLYAGLAVTTPTGVGGAVDEATLLGEGATRGLTPPPSAGG